LKGVTRNTFKFMKKFIFYILFLLILPSLFFPVLAQQDDKHYYDSQATTITADLRVERGLYLLDNPIVRLLPLTKKETVNTFDKLSKKQKLIAAISELKKAIQQKSSLKKHTVAEVHNLIGSTYVLLGMMLKEEYAASNYKNTKLNNQALLHFQYSIKHCLLAVKLSSDDKKYLFSRDLVETTIASGNLYQALEFISYAEREKFKPTVLGDYALLKLKADIFFLMGLKKEAGIEYEKWINKGNITMYLSSKSPILGKLLYLRRTTQHPNNIPDQLIPVDEKYDN